MIRIAYLTTNGKSQFQVNDLACRHPFSTYPSQGASPPSSDAQWWYGCSLTAEAQESSMAEDFAMGETERTTRTDAFDLIRSVNPWPTTIDASLAMPAPGDRLVAGSPRGHPAYCDPRR